MNPMTNSHLLVQPFSYHEPATVDEAAALLASLGDQARILSGGTDLLVQMKMERIPASHLVSLQAIPDLDQILVGANELRLGARASIRAIREHPAVQARFPALAEACASFSSTQIQVMGTIGGNLGNASPAADTAPALLVHGARVHIHGPHGSRELPLDEFFSGPGRSALRQGELLTAITLPLSRDPQGSAFVKISRVAADIAKVSAAVMVRRQGDQIVHCHLALGSVAPTPRRAHRAEKLLSGKLFDHERIIQAAQLAAEEMIPIDDVRSTARYRSRLVQVLVHDAFLQAWQRAAAPPPALPPDTAAATSSIVSLAQPADRDLAAGEETQMTLDVNGRRYRVRVFANDLLLSVLRDQLHLTGSKYGCGIGECGACTVQVDGQPALACLILAVSAANKKIVTVDGLQRADGALHPLQQAFIDQAAYQCGYCTPGMLMTAHALLAEKAQPGEEEIRDYMKGNLCRCTGYAGVVRAVLACTQATELEARQASK